MSITLKKLVDTIEEFAKNHGQIKSFGFGDFYQIDTITDRQYPCLWVTPIPSVLNSTQLNDKYQIAVFDALEEVNKTNELDVLSDCREIIIDVIRYFWEDIDGNGFVLDETTSTLVPFDHKFDITAAGYFAELTFIVEKSLNHCEVPEI